MGQNMDHIRGLRNAEVTEKQARSTSNRLLGALALADGISFLSRQ
jgi:hypothetical protein